MGLCIHLHKFEFMTSIMTLSFPKINQKFVLKYIYMASTISSKCLKCSWPFCWCIQLPVSLMVKCLWGPQKWQPFLKCHNIEHGFNLASNMIRWSQSIPEKYLYGDDFVNAMTGWPQSYPLYSCLGDVGSGNKLSGQISSINANIVIVFLEDIGN